MAQCQFVLDERRSTERGTVERPYVFRCPRCGCISEPTLYSDPRRLRRRCRWVDPKLAAFIESKPCWCRGLGDVIACLLSVLPERARHRAGRWVNVIEQRLTGVRTEEGKTGCMGCQRRRITLNTRFPVRWFRKLVCPPAIALHESAGDRVPVCLTFPHGLGDAVQFTAAIAHLKQARPLWDITVCCKPGCDSLFRAQGLNTIPMNSDLVADIDRAQFATVYDVRWFEPEETYPDSPATKLERCLREEFGIQPDSGLWRYQVSHQVADRAAARKALGSIANAGRDGRFRVVALHYQGNSFRSSKNPDENIAAELVQVIRREGYVPLVLDWEQPYRSELLRSRARGVKCFGQDHELWKGLGTGDALRLHAVLDQVALIVGIDSGPEHLAAATNTPTIIAWGNKTHPVNYFCPADNLLHIVRRDQGKYIFGQRIQGENFFKQYYRFQELRYHLRDALPEIVYQELRRHETHSRARLLDS